MNKIQIIKMLIHTYGLGLPAAIDKYNYLTCYGEITINESDIRANMGGVEE